MVVCPLVGREDLDSHLTPYSKINSRESNANQENGATKALERKMGDFALSACFLNMPHDPESKESDYVYLRKNKISLHGKEQ